MKSLGWEMPDVVLFSGDAYIDHPSFGTAVIARWMEHLGLKVAVVPQPNWQDDLRDFKKFGRPNLFFAVTAGNMDSMVNHYTANKRRRSDDMFTPGGKAGARPDYAVTVYTQILKKLYPEFPVIIGGIEASLRRLAHYDYWSDSLKPSILVESGADLLIYGMAEKPLNAVITEIRSGKDLRSLHNIRQIAYITENKEILKHDLEREVTLIPFELCAKDKLNHARNFRIIEEESNRDDAARIVEPTGDKFVIINPPFAEYTQEEIDAPYNLPYTRLPHPRYFGKEPVPAYDMIRDSVNIHRGCFGGCSFCTISAHQGKNILSRSEESIVNEVRNVAKTPGFHGTISDLGGPSANMYRMQGIDLKICRKCKRPSCIYPAICRNLNVSHKSLTGLYKTISSAPGIKHVYIGSGIRYDMFYNLHKQEHQQEAKEYFRNLVMNHVSGRLKVAPEHSSPKVLAIMRKPKFDLYLKLKADFEALNHRANKKQQLIPYLISSHPGSTIIDMAELAGSMRQIGYKPEQVQDFTPTPMTLATAIYYTGVDPYTLKPVFSAKSIIEKKAQQKYLLYYKPEVKTEIKRDLLKLNKVEIFNRIFGKRY
jgi:uncharacterized radical SAM protein YgiQ